MKEQIEDLEQEINHLEFSRKRAIHRDDMIAVDMYECLLEEKTFELAKLKQEL